MSSGDLHLSMLAQGGGGIAKKELGSIFFELTSGLGLTKYVSGRLSIYGNGCFHIWVIRSILRSLNVK